MLTVPCLVPDLIIPRGQSVSGHVVQASRLRHRSELTEEAWENAVQGLGKTVPRCSTRSMQMCGGSRTRFCLFVCFLDSTKSNPTVCKRFLLFLFHSFFFSLPHKTHLHFTINSQYLNDFRHSCK